MHMFSHFKTKFCSTVFRGHISLHLCIVRGICSWVCSYVIIEYIGHYRNKCKGTNTFMLR